MPDTLIVDDDRDFLLSFSELVRREGFEVVTAGSIAEAREKIAANSFRLVITDLSLPDGSGISLLQDLREQPTDVIMVTGQSTLDTAIEAIRLGALDYLTKPLDIPRLKTVLGNVANTRQLRQEIGTLREELRRFGRLGPMIGNSPVMQRVYDLIQKVAPTNASVFITGESGTGKELAAQTVHMLSRRARKPFLPLNCGAVPPTLIESELFGHERGSFTGATQMRRGHFERSSGGTLFLDEITEMPIELQVKLLRVLETGTVMRVGGDESIAVDLRIVAATNRPPEEAVRAGKLREDLLYRLNVFPVPIPPLRDREGDVQLLADVFLDELNKTEGTAKRFSAAARERMNTHGWPGNVRELKNEVHRSFIMADDVVNLESLSSVPMPVSSLPAPSGSPPSGDGASSGLSQTIPIGTTLAQAERQLILATLDHCRGDKRRAAEILGISLKTIYNRLNLYTTVPS
jgi:DNA-binding NtrC family response regulator